MAAAQAEGLAEIADAFIALAFIADAVDGRALSWTRFHADTTSNADNLAQLPMLGPLA